MWTWPKQNPRDCRNHTSPLHLLTRNGEHLSEGGSILCFLTLSSEWVKHISVTFLTGNPRYFLIQIFCSFHSLHSSVSGRILPVWWLIHCLHCTADMPEPVTLMTFLGLLGGFFLRRYIIYWSHVSVNNTEQVDRCDRLNVKDGLLFVAHCRVWSLRLCLRTWKLFFYQAGRFPACIRMRVSCVTAISAVLVVFFCFTLMFLSIPQVFRQNKLKPFLCIPMKSDLPIINTAVIGTQVAAVKCDVCSKGKNKVIFLLMYAPRMMTQGGVKV